MLLPSLDELGDFFRADEVGCLLKSGTCFGCWGGVGDLSEAPLELDSSSGATGNWNEAVMSELVAWFC